MLDDVQEARVVELVAGFLRQQLFLRGKVNDLVYFVNLEVNIAEDHLAFPVYLNLTVLAL